MAHIVRSRGARGERRPRRESTSTSHDPTARDQQTNKDQIRFGERMGGPFGVGGASAG